jgi:PAS domain S-box-containing protein
MAHMDARARDRSSAVPQLTDDSVGQIMAQMVECAPNGVALTRVDGRIVLVNAELERMFGFSRIALIGSSMERLIPERFRASHALLRDEDIDVARPRVMGAGRELFGLRADGSEFPIEVGIGALQGRDGTMVVETIVDISVRKRLERMFQKIVEAAPCGMVMTNSGGRILLVNPRAEAMFGYDSTELIGNALEMLLPERLRGVHEGHRQSFASAPSVRQVGLDREVTGRRKDGSEFPLEISLSPVPGEESGLVLAAVTDITQRKAMQLELRQASADLEEFTSAASHDLKSPLRGISDLLEWVVEDLGAGAPPQVMRNLSRVSDRIHRLERIIEDLLTYARAGKTSAGIEPIDIRELIDGVVELLPVSGEFRIDAQIDTAPFSGSRAPIETVLRNLITNAVTHHDRAAGIIRIRAVDEGRFCVFSVSDDGPGIPVASQQRVFRMFQTLAGKNHSGIGLPLCKRLVESHGGRITLESPEGGRGTTFKVWWPRFPWRE